MDLFFFEVFPYVSLNRLLFYPDVPDLDRSGQIVHLIDEDNIYIYIQLDDRSISEIKRASVRCRSKGSITRTALPCRD